jgi:hypothetical protein
MTSPQFPTDHGYPEPSQATTALVLGILGIPVQIIGPIAWAVASREIAAIHEGRRDPEGLQLATTARILGIIGTVLLVAGLVVAIVILAFFRSMF